MSLSEVWKGVFLCLLEEVTMVTLGIRSILTYFQPSVPK